MDTRESSAPRRRRNGEPRLYRCDGHRCGRLLPIRELVELQEGNHDNLAYFDGDRLCVECADAAGVMR